jgi:hypothetical protein
MYFILMTNSILAGAKMEELDREKIPFQGLL